MRKFLTGAVVTSTLIALPALAQADGFYIGADAGVALSTKSDQVYTPGATAGSTGKLSTQHKPGVNASAHIGYDFGRVRVEAEAGYLSSGVDKIKSDFTTPGGLTSGSNSADGDIRARTAMLNILFDAGEFADYTVYVGAGIGKAQLTVSDVTTSSGAEVLDDKDSDWRSAWQGIAGVRRPISDQVDFHLRYRYVNVSEAQMIGIGGRVVEADLKSHSVLAGLSLRF